MKYGILAAGEGSRLAQEGIAIPKPLVTLNGEPMIDRLIRIFCENDAEEIVVITNSHTPQVAEHLSSVTRHPSPVTCQLSIIQRKTPSSMHSFYELYPYLGTNKFCLTTVDTVFREDEFKDYIQKFNEMDGDGLMAVTDYVDDEKPLYIATAADIITGFYDTCRKDTHYISGGIYCLNYRSFATLERCISEGMSRMRNFQREMVKDGLRLHAYRFSKILDVDHYDDIKKAEDFLR